LRAGRAYGFCLEAWPWDAITAERWDHLTNVFALGVVGPGDASLEIKSKEIEGPEVLFRAFTGVVAEGVE